MGKVSALVFVAAALGPAACGGGAATHSSSSPATGKPASIQVTSDFRPGAAIPRVHTCGGADTSPPLRASGLPAGTRELVAIMRDPDAPGGDFTHWGIAHLEATNGSLALGPAAKPAGAVLGRNSFGSLGYRGPCPPAGPAHHYHITVYALAQPSGLKTGFSAGDVTGLPVLAQGTLIGTYSRH